MVAMTQEEREREDALEIPAFLRRNVRNECRISEAMLDRVIAVLELGAA